MDLSPTGEIALPPSTVTIHCRYLLRGAGSERVPRATVLGIARLDEAGVGEVPVGVRRLVPVAVGAQRLGDDDFGHAIGARGAGAGDARQGGDRPGSGLEHSGTAVVREAGSGVGRQVGE